MAELELRQETSSIYSNIENSENIPLFVRYSEKDKDKNKENAISFEDAMAQLSGIHECTFIHRRQKGKDRIYEELAIKFDDICLCMTAKSWKDGVSLTSPRFSEKLM